ncbi:hypothetical protein BV25DRAFT_347341 [Artomyces pyxidatus]|uniref:Uncharacterized protein n=1 Tax=Artomyces pyxidatus TaxID=48021 RepID=A0ACB8T7B0_9AGAM|nr:hypothetical protein BV25DRAFT_347341 [Artomyces pyxidatus]
MASSSTASSSSAARVEDIPPQAGPLPSKRGEIGFVEGVHGQEQTQGASGSGGSDNMPARHPADRSPTPSGTAGPPTSDTPSNASSDNLSTNSATKRSFLKRRNVPKFFGIRLDTILILLAQLLLFFGSIAAWVITTMVLGNKLNPPTNSNGMNSGSSAIFIHVAFGIVVLAQLVFLERRVFRVRAERYAHVHPGEMLPSSLRRRASRQDAAMPIAPWMRPPLPTYAAALAQSGVGTGDVEDSYIAQPPPPAYGKTRGSTLLLAGYLRNSLRAQARGLETDRRASNMTTRSDRPVSFRSIDEDWEERRDAERARRVEEALAALEIGEPAHVSDRR